MRGRMTAAAGLAAVTLAACGGSGGSSTPAISHPAAPPPGGVVVVPNVPVDDNDVVRYCVAGDGVYVIAGNDGASGAPAWSIAVAPNDPACS